MLLQPVREDVVTANDLHLHYVQWGALGKPIICIHGITANAFYFQALADNLAVDHRVYAYDLRGRGDSDKPQGPYNLPAHTSDLASLIDTLELDHPVVIGHSLGAFVALYFAGHNSEKLSKLVLIDGGAPLPWKTSQDRPAWLNTSFGRLGMPVPSFSEYIQRLRATPFLGPFWNEYMDRYFEHDVSQRDDQSVVSKVYREGALEDQLYLEEHNKPEQQWEHVQVPTLLLRADLGSVSDGDQLVLEKDIPAMQRGIKNMHYVHFPTLNHYTINFGVESGPVEEIRTFIDKEDEL